jgi:hypothetical protein
MKVTECALGMASKYAYFLRMKCVDVQYIYPVLLLVKLQIYFSDILLVW